MKNSVLVREIEMNESESLREDFEVLARSVKSCSAAHSFSGAEGVSVVWNSPLNCFRNSVATKAVVCHKPGCVPTPGRRFLDDVERLTCKELVLNRDTNEAAFVQEWNYTRTGPYERYLLIRQYSGESREVSEIVVDRRTTTVKTSRHQFGM